MEKQKIIKGVYSGNVVLGGSFNLHNINVNREKTQRRFVNFIKSLRDEINEQLAIAGLKMTNVKAYSPKVYTSDNGDDLELFISLTNKKKYLNFIKENEKELKTSVIDEAKKRIASNEEPNIAIIRYILYYWFNSTMGYGEQTYDCYVIYNYTFY